MISSTTSSRKSQSRNTACSINELQVLHFLIAMLIRSIRNLSLSAISLSMITEEERKLAHELAHALNDKLSIGYYRKKVKEIPHDVLREILARVLAVKDEDVRTSRGRIFTETVKAYEEDVYAGTRN